MVKKERMRNEMDALGVKKVPADSYGGIFWVRARENFSISTRRFPSLFFHNLALLKKVAAHEHTRTKRLDAKVGNVIQRACNEVMAGKYNDAFDLDVYQAGAGTPLNMTMNEVIANRALELMGKRKGKYSMVHPNSHVNLMQSTNDVIPTTIRLTLVDLSEMLEKELILTIQEAENLSKKYAHTLKTGRTHLQTAVPVTFGQELYAYAQSLRDGLRKIREAREGLYELSLGGTAVGTGITTEPGYDVKVVSAVRRATHQPYYPSHRKMHLTSHMTVFSHYSNALSELADELVVWANDWMLLGSDPRAGIGEIILPEVEPGSSIMPGKVNPSILEALKMICVQVQGNNETVRLSVESTQLELNVLTPVLASNLFESATILTNGLKMFRTKCVKGIKPSQRMQSLLTQSVSIGTALNPYLGYDVVSFLVKKTLTSHQPIERVAVGMGILSSKEAATLLDASALTHPHKVDSKLKSTIQSRPAYQKVRKLVQKYAR